MKILSAVLVTSLSMGSMSQAVKATSCRVPPQGEYRKQCKEVHIQPSTDSHGISQCTLSATCQLPPEKRSAWVASTLVLDEKEFGLNSTCSISVNDKGQLACEKKGTN